MHLFITGPSRTGKTAMLSSVLSPYQAVIGGYYVSRHMRNGRVMAYVLCEASSGAFQIDAVYTGEAPRAFLTWRDGRRVMNLSVFDEYGTDLLKQALGKKLVLLDEIGGIELLSDAFYDALCTLLRSQTPCIGVYKSKAAIGRMSRDVEDVEACIKRRTRLRDLLLNDTNTELLHVSDEDTHERIKSFVENTVGGCMER